MRIRNSRTIISAYWLRFIVTKVLRTSYIMWCTYTLSRTDIVATSLWESFSMSNIGSLIESFIHAITGSLTSPNICPLIKTMAGILTRTLWLVYTHSMILVRTNTMTLSHCMACTITMADSLRFCISLRKRFRDRMWDRIRNRMSFCVSYRSSLWLWNRFSITLSLRWSKTFSLRITCCICIRMCFAPSLRLSNICHVHHWDR